MTDTKISMHQSLLVRDQGQRKQIMNKKTDTAQGKKPNNYKIIPTPSSPTDTLIWINQHPYPTPHPDAHRHLSHVPSFIKTIQWTKNSWCKWDNIINAEVKGIMKYSTYTWDLVQALEVTSPASCKTPATFIDSICPNNQPEKCKGPRNEIKLTTNRIVLPWSTHTEPRALRGRLGIQL